MDVAMRGVVIRLAVILGAFLLCSGINEALENNLALLIVCEEGGKEPNCADIQNELSGSSSSRDGRDRDDRRRRLGVIRVRRPGPVRVTIIPIGNGINGGSFQPGFGNPGPGMGNFGPGMGFPGPVMGNTGTGMGNFGPGMVNSGPGMRNFGPTSTGFGQGGFRRPITGGGGDFRPIRRRIPGQGFRRRGTGGFRRRRPVFGGRRRVGVRRPTGDGDLGPRRGGDRPIAPVIGSGEINGGRRRTPLP